MFASEIRSQSLGTQKAIVLILFYIDSSGRLYPFTIFKEMLGLVYVGL